MSPYPGNGGPRGVSGYAGRKSPHPYDDIFDGPALSAKWTQSSTPPGASMSGAGAVILSSLGQGRHLRQQGISLPTNFTLYVRVSSLSSRTPMFGLFMLDASGNGVGYSNYSSSNGQYLWTIVGYNYSATGPTNGTFYDPDMWLRLRKSGTNFYGAQALHNPYQTYLNQSFTAELGPSTSSVTVDRIGFGSFFSASGTAVVEEFRFVPN